MNVFRDKVFVVIGVKVYPEGLYTDQLIVPNWNAWKGMSKAEIHRDESFFNSIHIVDHQATSLIDKSLRIVLVRDVDGETFWKSFHDTLP
ncbi:hypothetical protein MLD38_000583 [Melastoma candidum]|uniref:Uncharacterized protein n=1 Tax=Melastoma candidum TaxID=119954 RepID=A0ACB9SDV9_9MYRT|nr:hypothetical protein MLD38_000583 [Melastoma candidum]